MSGIKTYNPKKVTGIIDGMVVTGYSEGTMIKCEKNEDNIMPHVGVLGEVSVAINADNTGKISFSLSNTSPWIGILSRMARANEIFSCNMIDMNTNGVNAGGSQCMVIKAPDLSIGKEVEDQDIEIFVADYTVG